MKPRTQRRQHAGEDKRFPRPCLGPPQHFPSEIVVVVLGVMYPSVLPQPVDATTHLDLPLPSLGLDTPRQSADVVFHDPLSSQRNGDEASPALKYGKKHKGTGYENRTEAQKAVARDLTLLFLAKTRVATSYQLPSCSDTFSNSP
jgi:hypothetical protein